MRARWLLLRYELDLRINPRESDHQHLVESIDRLWRSRRNVDFIGSRLVVATVAKYQAILKREWERVKAGEQTPAELRGEVGMAEKEQDREETRRNLQTTRRDEMMIHAVRGLLIANGGGAVALLAFLQAIWSEDASLSLYVVCAQALMTLGVFFAGLVLLVRYETTIREQRGTPSWRLWSRAYRITALVSLLFFLAGALAVTLGALVSRGSLG